MTCWKDRNNVASRYARPALLCTNGAHKKSNAVPPDKLTTRAFSQPILCIGEWSLYKSPFMAGYFAKHLRFGSFYIAETYRDRAIEIFKQRIQEKR